MNNVFLKFQGSRVVCSHLIVLRSNKLIHFHLMFYSIGKGNSQIEHGKFLRYVCYTFSKFINSQTVA